MSIVDLPSELVLEIGQYLILIDPPHCLLSFFSQTCRRFHDIFASFIITHHVRAISESPIPQRFVIAARGQTNISESSSFSLNGDFKEMSLKLRAHCIINDIRCFRNLIFQANTISRIEVDLGHREASHRVIVCLLNTCVQRSDLHLKIVEHTVISWDSRDLEGPFIFKVNSKASTPRITAPVKTSWSSFVLGALKALSSKCRLKLTNGNPPPPIPPSTCSGIQVVPRKPRFGVPYPHASPRLTGLWVEGDFLFSASMYPWTRNIMNAAPLTHLSISYSTLTLFDWSQILPSITIPTLTYLAIGQVPVAFPDLSDFFNRHPSLQTINLSENELIGTISFLIKPKSSLLPRLNTLVATPEYIYPFICHQQGGYFPELNSYDLRPISVIFDYKIQESRFCAIFELLAGNPPTHLSITLSGTALNSLIRWFLETSGQNSIVGHLRKLPGIWKVVLVGGTFSRRLLREGVRTLLAERARWMKTFAFLNDISSRGEPFLLDHLFHTICPDLQLIEYKEVLAYNYSDWSMII